MEESAAVDVASMKVPTTVGKRVRLRYKNVGEARASMKALQKKEWEIVLAQVADRGIPMPQ